MPKAIYAPLLLTALLAGCGWMSEEDQYYLHRDFERAKSFDWQGAATDMSGIETVWPSPRTLRLKEEEQACLHGHGENRVVSENTVSDYAVYRRCVLDPYPQGEAAPGQRMGNRPWPQS
ncbi:MAG: hypothetical protein GC129_01210 [Proteobacteria bacterium]|nr:hypothetical protein [Pseudomonadota bacterium]